MSKPEIINAGLAIRPIRPSEIAADMAAEASVRDATYCHLTIWAKLTARGAIRCVCDGQALRDADEVKCLMCGRTLAWIGQVPIKQADAASDLVDLKSSEQHRKAAQARWSGQRNTCQRGHKVEGENAMPHGDEPPDCRTCWLARRTRCGNGHAYTDETTYRSADGRKLCTVCRDNRRRRSSRAG